MTEGFGVGVDWNQWQSWNKVVAPNGQVYYEVPGNPGYLFDPFLTKAKGRPVIFQNPSAQVAEKEKAEREAKKQASPWNQALPIAGGAAGAVVANNVVDRFSPPTAQDKYYEALTNQSGAASPAQTGQQAFTDAALKGSAPPTPGATAAPSSPAGAVSGSGSPMSSGFQPNSIPSGSPVPEGFTAVGTAPDGSTMIVPDGAISSGASAGQGFDWQGGAQAVGGVAQGYQGYQQFKDGQKIAGAGNMLGGAYNTYAGLTGNAGSYAPGVGAAVAAANIGQNVANEEGNSEDRAAASQAEAAKAAMLAVPVYGQIAYAVLAGIDAVSDGEGTKQLTRGMKNMDKFNDRIDFGVGKAVRSKVFHQSTRGVQKEHTGKLLAQSDDPEWQAYVQGMRAQHQEGPLDPTKPFAGKYASWDEYKAAGLEADDLTGVYGNLDAFKPDWAEKEGLPDWSKLTFDQQRAVTQEIINADLYKSKKGEVEITDKDRARDIYREMAARGFAPGSTPATEPDGELQPMPRPTFGSPAGQPAPVMPPRSSTLSPGIGLDGRPVSSSREAFIRGAQNGRR